LRLKALFAIPLVECERLVDTWRRILSSGVLLDYLCLKDNEFEKG